MSRENELVDQGLSRRERQIMEALYRLGPASAAEIRDALPDAPTNTAVRTLLTILVNKGHVKFQKDGARHIYEPVVSKDEMAKSVIKNVVQNFFGGSVERVVATLVNSEESNLSSSEMERLIDLIDQAKKEGR